MTTPAELVGRQAEHERLREALDAARAGSGSLTLLAGEAGVGKTRLAEDIACASGEAALWGRTTQGGSAPYGPIVAVLRSYLREHADGLAALGPLKAHLALILPEVGEPAPASDRATLFEAVHAAFARVAEDRTLIVLDDLQWSDEATLDLLSALAEPLGRLPLLVVAAYRSDGLPRDHMLRRLRHDLRRSGRLSEVVLHPLDEDQTGELLARVLGGRAAPSLIRAVHDRTQGLPFYVEELARALRMTG